jgi:hypothetical protein
LLSIAIRATDKKIRRPDVISMVVAILSALLLGELGFDPRDTAYWRRWVGRCSYLWRRLALALPPALLAAAISQVHQEPSLLGQLTQGALAGVTAAAVLRADANRVHMRASDIVGADAARAVSALSWIYERAGRHLDALAQARVFQELTRQKLPGPGYPDEILCTAEEIAGALDPERRSGASRARKIAQERMEALREHMDVLLDPLASEHQRRAAAFALSELVSDEIVTRRWSRPPAFQQPKEERWWAIQLTSRRISPLNAE